METVGHVESEVVGSIGSIHDGQQPDESACIAEIAAVDAETQQTVHVNDASPDVGTRQQSAGSVAITRAQSESLGAKQPDLSAAKPRTQSLDLRNTRQPDKSMGIARSAAEELEAQPSDHGTHQPDEAVEIGATDAGVIETQSERCDKDGKNKKRAEPSNEFVAGALGVSEGSVTQAGHVGGAAMDGPTTTIGTGPVGPVVQQPSLDTKPSAVDSPKPPKKLLGRATKPCAQNKFNVSESLENAIPMRKPDSSSWNARAQKGSRLRKSRNRLPPLAKATPVTRAVPELQTPMHTEQGPTSNSILVSITTLTASSVSKLVCIVAATRFCPGSAVMATVEFVSGIPAGEQRLFAGDREFEPFELVDALGAEIQAWAVHLRLARRNLEQGRWLGRVRHRGLALASASSNIRKCRAIALAAVEESARALQFVSEDLRDDIEVVLMAVKGDGYALRFASAQLRGDREVVSAAVQQNGLALSFAAAHCLEDRELVLCAVRQNPAALQFASEADRKSVV